MRAWMMIACVCMCGSEVCGGLGAMRSRVNASVDAYAVGVWVCVCLRTVVLDVWCLVCVVCCVVCVRLRGNDLGAGAGAAMAGAVQHLTSLTTLKYV